MTTDPATEAKLQELSMHLEAVIRLAKAMPVESDPYAGVNIPDPIGETIDISNHPAIHKAAESFKAARIEVGIATAVVNVAKMIGESFGLVVGV